MLWVHVLRGTYIAVSVAVALAAQWRLETVTQRDRIGGAAFAAYAIATAAAQMFAFNKPLTLGTAYVGLGVVGGVAWLISLAVERRKASR